LILGSRRLNDSNREIPLEFLRYSNTLLLDYDAHVAHIILLRKDINFAPTNGFVM
jgi:hypothetical protein